MGINTDWYASKTSGQTTTDIANLQALGINHIREFYVSPSNGLFSTWSSELQQVGNAGIKVDMTFSNATPFPTASTLESIPALISPALEYIEAPTEYDNAGDPNWVANLSSYIVNTFYPIVHTTMGYPALGPAMAYTGNAPTLGDLHNYLDYGSTHNYLDGGYSPGLSTGTFVGCGGFEAFSVDWDMACESSISGGVTFANYKKHWCAWRKLLKRNFGQDFEPCSNKNQKVLL